MKKNKTPFPLSGLLLVNKESGVTSHDVVSKVRRALGTKAVGHTGTLDPMAEGLMVLLIEKATKLSPWIMSEDKIYTGVAKLGETTTTGDFEGSVLKKFPNRYFSLSEVQDAAISLKGLNELRVPKYSAVKIDGEKLYNKARAGVDFLAPLKIMNFFDSKVFEVSEGIDAHFYVHCSKGSYIRSWSERLGECLESGAHLKSLKRETVGSFKLESAISFKQIDELSELDVTDKASLLSSNRGFVPFEKALSYAEILYLSDSESKLFINGQLPHKVRPRLHPMLRESIKAQKDHVVRIFNKKSNLLGLVSLASSGQVKISRVFNS